NKENIKTNTRNLMEMVGLNPDEFLKRYPNELSGGQQQRVGVARALANNPDIILMDEPFSALDPITRSDLQDELIQLQSNVKKTIVFVTHDMNEAIKIADRICIMKDGEIHQCDTPENILKNPADDFVSNFVGKNRIWNSPEFIKVSDIMIDKPVTTSINLSVMKCLDKMRIRKVDSLLVVEVPSKKLIGIIKASELRAVSDRALPIKDFLHTDYPVLSPNDSILDSLKIAREKHRSTIPVVDNSGKLLGLVTRSTLITALSQQYFEGLEEVEL
ncbi:MAG: CBS domain-containing protein, partial [Fusobacterium sp.]|nr:CBS domain-containing protein [Fusobacterium sp.]